MLYNAHKHRLKSIKDYGIKHSTLIEACTRKIHSQSFRAPANDEGSGHPEDYYEDDFWHNDQEINRHDNQRTCAPYNEYGILLKHLRTCSEPEISLPLEITDLSLHY